MKPKFGIGDKVKHLQDGEICEVVSFTVSEAGIVYKITSKEVDIKAKEVINGYKHVGEDELEAHSEEE